MFSNRPSRALALLADNRQMVGKLTVVVALMFCFGYALVPIYKAVCTALGINVLAVSELKTGGGANGSTSGAVNSQVDSTRTITVEFDANARGPWDFKPEQASVDVHPGQLTTVMYGFHNRQAKAIAVQAIPSFAPGVAMSYFNKVECFCFSQHTLQANESVRWPVVFVIDPKLPKDVHTITLSYTFFEVGGKVPAEPAQAVRSVSTEPRS